jgi:hypothetical protein
VADYPDEAVQRAAEVMLRQYETQYDAAHLTWRDFADDARAILDAALPALDGERDGVWARVRSYDVSVWPDDIECVDSSTWKLTVEYRGRGKWAVTRTGRVCLGSDGEWDWESIPSERQDEWLTAHRFPLAEALDLARRHAPDVKINGMTAAEVLERHRQRHPDGRCNA